MKFLDKCPYCGSHNVQDRIVEAQCLDCGSIDKFSDEQPPYQETQQVSTPPAEAPARPTQFQQIKGELRHLENKLNEHLARAPKGKSKYA